EVERRLALGHAGDLDEGALAVRKDEGRDAEDVVLAGRPFVVLPEPVEERAILQVAVEAGHVELGALGGRADPGAVGEVELVVVAGVEERAAEAGVGLGALVLGGLARPEGEQRPAASAGGVARLVAVLLLPDLPAVDGVVDLLEREVAVVDLEL